MAYLAVVASHTVNGVAAIHSDIIRNTIFKACMPDLAPAPPCPAPFDGWHQLCGEDILSLGVQLAAAGLQCLHAAHDTLAAPGHLPS
jgi:hypothetical protein